MQCLTIRGAYHPPPTLPELRPVFYNKYFAEKLHAPRGIYGYKLKDLGKRLDKATKQKGYGLERGTRQATREELTTNDYTAQRQRENIKLLEERQREAEQNLKDLKQIVEAEEEKIRQEIKPEGLKLIQYVLHHIKGFYKRLLEVCEQEYNKYIKQRQNDYMSLQIV